jgi:hypothetical protein
MRPTELFRRNSWISLEPVEGSLSVLADYIGPHKIMWATGPSRRRRAPDASPEETEVPCVRRSSAAPLGRSRRSADNPPPDSRKAEADFRVSLAHAASDHALRGQHHLHRVRRPNLSLFLQPCRTVERAKNGSVPPRSFAMIALNASARPRRALMSGSPRSTSCRS